MNGMAIALVFVSVLAVAAAMGVLTWAPLPRGSFEARVARAGACPVSEYASRMADEAGDPVVGGKLAGYRIGLGRGG
jgi:hypothetical protein